jgi:uncharacterized protein (DUF2164 family)
MGIQELEEIIGDYTGLKQEKNHYVLLFNLSVKEEVEIPVGSIDEKFLHEFIGSKIGLLRCDDHYYIKRIDGD